MSLSTRAVLAIVFFIAALWVWMFLSLSLVHARDLNGEYKDSPLHSWFDSLASGHGLCCSFADGQMIDDPDIDTDGTHYKVRIDGQWIVVEDSALVTVPNKFGRAIVWPYKDASGATQIRCFLPGAGI